MSKLLKVALIFVLAVTGIVFYRLHLSPPKREAPVAQQPAHREPILIPGVQEPEEMRVEPFPVATLSPPEQMLADEMQKLSNNSKAEALMPALDLILRKYPDFSNGYTMRLAALCSGKDLKAILSDVNSSLKYVDVSIGQRRSRSGLLSMRAKIEHTQDQDPEAVRDLELAIQADLAESPQFVNSGGTAPEKSASTCTWTEPDMDFLVRKYPNDYRTYEYRGIYYSYFASWDESSLKLAVDNFHRAIDINPTDASLHFLIAHSLNRAFAIKRYGLSDGDREKLDQAIVDELDKALTLDPNLLSALSERAEAYFELKEFAKAVPDYDKVVTLNPKDSGAYNDRGLAKVELGDLYGAISDFGIALDNKDRALQQTSTQENRADAYMKTRQWDLAIRDLTTAISLQIGGVSLISNIKQFRALYPEYKPATNEDIAHKINQTFYPSMKYEDFSKRFLDETREFWDSMTIPDLYLKRADAYMSKNDWTKAAIEFRRAVAGFPKYSDSFERWREIDAESKPRQHLYLDLRTFDDKDRNSVKIWTKETNSGRDDGPYIVERYELNCDSQQLRSVSTASYNKSGTLTSSREGGQWQTVVPETLGERFVHGACREN